MFLVQICIKKRAGERLFCYLSFPTASFLYTLLPSPRDTLELLGQILIKRNRYWLNTSLFNFDTYKGLTVKIYIILVCTQQQWTLQVTPVGFLLIKNNKKREAALKNEAGGLKTRLLMTLHQAFTFKSEYLCCRVIFSTNYIIIHND